MDPAVIVPPERLAWTDHSAKVDPPKSRAIPAAAAMMALRLFVDLFVIFFLLYFMWIVMIHQ
jgi:hypothetical protein